MLPLPPSRLMCTTPTPLDTVKTGKSKTKTKNRGPPCSTSESSSSEDQDPIPNVDDDEPFHDLPSQLPSTPNWEFIGQRISKRFGSREVWYDHQSQLHNANTISEVLDYLWTSLEEIKDIVLRDTSPRDYVRLILISAQLNVPVSFPWATVEHFDISPILDRIEEVLNSNQFFFLDLGFTIRLHVYHIVNPAGGRARKFDGPPEQLAALKKRSIITIPPSDDNLCFVKALVIAMLHSKNDKRYRTWTKNKQDCAPTKQFMRMARDLHARANVEEGIVDSRQYAAFQAVLAPEFRLMVYRGRRKEALICAGPPEGKAIYLYLSGSHYNVITNPSAFLCASQLCEDCHETYNYPLTHISVVVNEEYQNKKRNVCKPLQKRKENLKTVQSTSSLILNVLRTR